MAKRRSAHLVALAVDLPSSLEEETALGAMDYAERVGRWEFVFSRGRPFVPFEEIDLSSVDGVIGRFYVGKGWDQAVRQAGVAAVNAPSSGPPIDLPHVGVDEQSVGRMGAAYLLNRGFQELCFIYTPAVHFSHQRFIGFKRAVEQAGRRCHELPLSANWQKDGRKVVGERLANLPKPLAIMVPMDTWGRDVLQLAKELKLRVPEDLAVLGVDNDRWLAAAGTPPMSSIEIDERQIGYLAAKMLDELMAGRSPRPIALLEPVGVVTRRSTEIVLTEDTLVDQATAFIKAYACQGITVEEMLDELNVSRTTLEQRMKKATGQTPHAAICLARIDRAKQMLGDSNETIEKIAWACGFPRQARLNEVFKRLTGMTPGQYRQQRAGTPTDASVVDFRRDSVSCPMQSSFIGDTSWLKDEQRSSIG